MPRLGSQPSWRPACHVCRADLAFSDRFAFVVPGIAHHCSTAPPHPRAAAYLVWGAAKAQMRGSEPELQRVLPAVLEHTESMKVSGVWPVYCSGSNEEVLYLGAS